MGGVGMGNFGQLGSVLGSGASSLGAGVMGGATKSANTTSAVSDPRGEAGALKAYDPTTMATRTIAPTPPASPILGAGMATSGVPDYVSNWLQSGGTGVMPHASLGDSVFKNNEVSKVGAVYKPPIAAKEKVQGDIVAPATTAGTPAGTTAGTPAGTTAAPALTQHSSNYAQPLYVNDQWNFQTGTSQPMATPALGGPSANQGGQAPVWSDGKGNYFFDAQGARPVTGPALTQFRNMYGQ